MTRHHSMAVGNANARADVFFNLDFGWGAG